MAKEIRERMKELIQELNEAGQSYYNGIEGNMSDFEYDSLYNELEILERESGLIMSGSPTQKVGYKVTSKLEKQEHSKPMLSLNKTKNKEDVESFVGNRESVLSYKLDGLTVVLRYEKGELVEALTRGNGRVGEVITENAKHFKNIPLRIQAKEELLVRGEALISYAEFDRINKTIKEDENKYKNPRNLCSGSVRQLDSNKLKDRGVEFIAFELISYKGVKAPSYSKGLGKLEELGFTIVAGKKVTSKTVSESIDIMGMLIKKGYKYPTDGLVVRYNNQKDCDEVGETNKYPRYGLAYKWGDDVEETKLERIEWNVSRTGRVNPIAVFKSVELEGTTVSRASVHNISVMEKLGIYDGATVGVYKANMIIPQIAYVKGKGQLSIIRECPECGKSLSLEIQGKSKELYCRNKLCKSRGLSKLELYVKRDALNIEGLSKGTIEKLIENGVLSSRLDIYSIKDKEAQITQIEGLGKQSYKKLVESIEKSRDTKLENFLYGLGIEHVGRSVSRQISEKVGGDFKIAFRLTKEDLLSEEGVGEKIATSYVEYFADESNRMESINLYEELRLEKNNTQKSSKSKKLEGLVIVITGKLQEKTRSEMVSYIESYGGRVGSSVSRTTNYLINNDDSSTSSKSNKARALGVEVMTEAEFYRRMRV